METKHFSHQHPLAFHQVHQGSQTHCSGCKSPATGNVYACWQCNYFLHEHCFHAARSLRHPSHPLHPLSLVPLPTYPSASFICNSCNLPGDGFSYCCTACDFDIHVHCALIPNPNPNSHYHHPQNPSTYPPPNPIQPTTYPTMAYPPPPQNYAPPPTSDPPHPTYSTVVNATTANPPPTGYPQPNPPAPAAVVNPTANPPPTGYPQPNPPAPAAVVNPTANLAKPPAAAIIKHFSHPHVLKQMDIEEKKAKVCSACECELSGSAYCCTEAYCTFNLHKDCFDSPREVRHKSHLDHPLTLLSAPPYSDGFTCNACLKDGKGFAYNCAACSYDLHIDCVRWPDAVARPDHKHELKLYYSSAAGSGQEAAAFECDVCRNPVHEMAWLYLCRECDFGTHLECVASGIIQQQDTAKEDELLREMELKFAVLQLLLGAQAQRGAPSIV
ncbi:hypothetical protein SASPL_145662 [Salvia splendens]|uniref:DC1 domain-containing protein n=1 Tax=Salvia splendens TaxID=180675 RepID=A0A8X8WJH9_SALSN|nr:uncharacterized protein LOC121773974 [Salvia splendens]KAG6395071.1 hypothetical protein SASPL_145662 [Salvia splendens]